MPLVINSLRGGHRQTDTQTDRYKHTHTHTHTDVYTETILRNQACAWFEKVFKMNVLTGISL